MDKNKKSDKQSGKLQWNPLDSNNTVGGLVKTAYSLEAGSSIVGQIIWQSFYIFLVIYFSAQLKITPILAIVAAICAGISLWIYYRSYKVIRTLPNENSLEGFQNIFILRELYKIQKSIADSPTSLIFWYLLILYFVQKSPGFEFVPHSVIIFLILIFAGNFLVDQTFGIIRYLQYKRHLPEAKNKAHVTQIAKLIDEKIGLVGYLITMPIFFALALLVARNIANGVPGLATILASTGSLTTIVIAIIVFASTLVIMPVLSMVIIRRINSIDFSQFSDPVIPVAVDSSPVISKERRQIIDSEERLVSLYGIWNTHSYSVEVLGKGQRYDPENTLIITPHRLVFLKVPVFGAGVSMDGIDYTTEANIWGRADIRAKAEELVQSHTLDELVERDKDNFVLTYDKIKEAKLIKKGFINVPRLEVHSIDGRSRAYCWLDKTYRGILESTLPKVLGDRAIID
ncbi:MAG: hypothetical protein WCT32_02660 [Patescibacteria group bacterium]